VRDIKRRIRALERRRRGRVEVTPQAVEVMALLDQYRQFEDVPFEERRRIVHETALAIAAEYRRYNSVLNGASR
jgi:hypothetical protein